VPAVSLAAQLGGFSQATILGKLGPRLISGRASFNSSIIRVAMPDDPEEKPELPILEAVRIAILLWVVMGILFLWGLYLFW
jgi:hypothetical protein